MGRYTKVYHGIFPSLVKQRVYNPAMRNAMTSVAIVYAARWLVQLWLIQLIQWWHNQWWSHSRLGLHWLRLWLGRLTLLTNSGGLGCLEMGQASKEREVFYAEVRSQGVNFKKGWAFVCVLYLEINTTLPNKRPRFLFRNECNLLPLGLSEISKEVKHHLLG